MSVKHAFANPKADGGDATLTRPSDWNAAHVIDPATITLAMMADLAQSTIVGRAAAAGTGVPTALTPAQAKTALAIATADVSGLAAIASSGSGADLTAASVTLAKIVNVSATQRVIGRNTAGAGVQEEVTASQLFDWASNTNGVLLTRTAGTWGALANVTTDNGDLQIATNASPVAPAAGKVKLYAQDVGGRAMLAALAPAGAGAVLQPFLGQRNVCAWIPQSNATVFSTIGESSVTATGTATARAFATTTLLTSLKRIGYVSAAGAGSVAGPRSGAAFLWRGNAALAGGFTTVFRFAVSDAVIVTTGRTFVGAGPGGVPTDVDPSTLVNILGVGCDTTDTTLQLYAAGAAAQARVSLGANFPINVATGTDIYELSLYAPPNGSTVTYRVTRLNTGDTASGTISAGANLPSNTTALQLRAWRSNGATAAAVGLDIMGQYTETDY